MLCIVINPRDDKRVNGETMEAEPWRKILTEVEKLVWLASIRFLDQKDVLLAQE
jgi:hypothetical protein